MKNIELFHHNIEQEEIDNCVKVLNSKWHTSGPVGEEVEKRINDYFGGYSALTNGCSNAMVSAAIALGLASGDEVITTPMSFISTTTSFARVGAKPVFVDIDMATGLINDSLIEKAITSKTKAIWITNLYGHMVDVEKIRYLADKHGLWFVEDCAHAFDSARNGIKPSHKSHVACFSFYANKTHNCGDGGAAVSRDKNLIERIKRIRRHGMTKIASPTQFGNMGYDITELGIKGNLPDINASLLLTQIGKSDRRRDVRNRIAHKYYNAFKTLNKIKCVMPPPSCVSSFYTFPMLVESRDSLITALAAADIGHTIMYQSIESFTLFGKRITCKNAQEFANHQLSIPCHHYLTDEEVSKIIQVVLRWCCG